MVWSRRGEREPGRALAAWSGRTNRPSVSETLLVVRAPLLRLYCPAPPQACVQTATHHVGWLVSKPPPRLSRVGPTTLSWPLVPLQNRQDHTVTHRPRTAMCRVWALAPALDSLARHPPGATTVPPGTSWASEGPAVFTAEPPGLLEPLATIRCLAPPDSTSQLPPDPEPPAPTPHLVT